MSICRILALSLHHLDSGGSLEMEVRRLVSIKATLLQ